MFNIVEYDLIAESKKIDELLEKQAKGIRAQIIQLDKDIKAEEEKKNKAAEEGDLRENAGYQTAMENLARMHVEMRNLDAKERAFKQFKFSGDYESSGFIGLGTTVHLNNLTDRSAKVIKLVPSDLGDASIRAVSIESPVGLALIGRSQGDVFTVTTQARKIDYEVKAIH